MADLIGPTFQLLVNEFSDVVVTESDDPRMSAHRTPHTGQRIKNVEALGALLKLAQKLLNY